MSDISLEPGLGIAVGFLLTLFAGGGLVIGGVIVGTATSLAQGERRWHRLLRCCIPALVCWCVGLAYAALADLVNGATQARLENWAFGVPIAGVVLGLAVGVALAQRRRRRRRAMTLDPASGSRSRLA